MHQNLKAISLEPANLVPQILPALTSPVSPTAMSLLGSQIAGSQVLPLTLVEAWKSTVGSCAEEPNTTLPLFSENVEEDRVIGQAIHPWLRLFYLELNVHEGHCYVFDLSAVCFFFFWYILVMSKRLEIVLCLKPITGLHWLLNMATMQVFSHQIINKRSDLGLWSSIKPLISRCWALCSVNTEVGAYFIGSDNDVSNLHLFLCRDFGLDMKEYTCTCEACTKQLNTFRYLQILMTCFSAHFN